MAAAESGGQLHGTVTDQLGNVIPRADIVVLQDDKEVVRGSSDAQGSFTLAVPASGRYQVRVQAAGFAAQALSSVSIDAGKTTDLTASLQVGSLTEDVVVSATGTAVSESQVGASVSVIDSQEIDTLNKLDVLENLRQIPGAQVVQTSQRGGTTSLFLRGGDSNFTKVLVDGVPANDIGGSFDFAQLSTNGVGNIEVLRGSNSVLYGSDAMSGVVNVTSRRGATSAPQLQYSADGGTFGTMKQDASLGGVIRHFDYFSEFSRFDTRNNVPNAWFHNATVNANVGWQIDSKTGIRATYRHAGTGLGSPNAFDFYGITDDSYQNNHNTYAGVTLQQQTTDKWHNSVQFAYGQFIMFDENPTPTGQAVPDPYYYGVGTGYNYLGNTVTIKGANGYSVTGQAILDYDGTYPSIYPDYQARRSVYAQSDYQFHPDFTGVFGFRYEHENGDGYTRDNYSGVLEGHGDIAHRLFATFGGGFEHNSLFDYAVSPRVSLAYYLRRPTNEGFLGDTKLKFNFGQGITEPTTTDQAYALISLLTPAQIAQYNVQPIGPERSRTYDFGLDQRLFNARAMLGITFFYNQFYDLVVGLGESALVSIGVPSVVASAVGYADVNASSERTMGAEIEYKMDLGHGFLFKGEYTYLDPVTTKAFGDAAYNPAFPTIPIGMYSPLIGARPFRRAPHSGSFGVYYGRKNFSASLSSYIVSRSDDSTYLSDANEGNTMLLPNRNLEPGYQKADMSIRYAVKSYLSFYSSMENIFNEHYQGAFGFPSLPFTIRSGLTLTLGGERHWWK